MPRRGMLAAVQRLRKQESAGFGAKVQPRGSAPAPHLIPRALKAGWFAKPPQKRLQWQDCPKENAHRLEPVGVWLDRQPSHKGTTDISNADCTQVGGFVNLQPKTGAS